MEDQYSPPQTNQYPSLPSEPYRPPESPPAATAPPPPAPRKKPSFGRWFVFGIIVAFLILGGIFWIYVRPRLETGIPSPGSTPVPTSSPQPVGQSQGFKKFASEEEFLAYLKESSGAAADLSSLVSPLMTAEGVAKRDLTAIQEAPVAYGGGEIERVSETNVQVVGIDEPDIVKTDGVQIYHSVSGRFFRSPSGIMPVLERGVISPGGVNKTRVIKAFPPVELAPLSEIQFSGNLLLSGKTLLVWTVDGQLIGFDVSDPKVPVEKWRLEMEGSNQVIEARLYEGKVYVVAQSQIDPVRPCPVPLYSLAGSQVSISCPDIYHPTVSVPADVTFTAMVLEPTSGQVEKKISFVGSSGSSVIYMSPQAIYTGYSHYDDMLNFLFRFFRDKGEDLVPSEFITRLETLQSYDLGLQAKMVEFAELYQQYLGSLDEDERLRVENEFSNRMNDFAKEHQREFEKTTLVKIGLADLAVLGTGQIPGRPLNQFSLDEYQGYLRVATTVGGRIWGTAGESANDIYVLDSQLKTVGSLLNLGLGERIYSARFIEDKGYLVTFKQVDPFFVLDLSRPENPQVKGELKIPGYSSYLHPITKDKILGVGKEGSQVKLALFDVANPESPVETSKYLLDEYWSDILNTHHAFLLDEKHQIFFLPGRQGGYVFGYAGDGLQLKKAVAEIAARRALYINDYLYIVGDNQLVVLNEADWEQVNQIEY